VTAAQNNLINNKDPHQPYLEMLRQVQAGKPTSAKLGYAWAVLASSYQRSGETDAALRAYGQALPLLAQSAESRVNYATALDNLGEVYLERGDVAEAERVREKAFRIRSELNNPIDLARSHQHLAEILLAEHRYKSAAEHAQAAVSIFTLSAEPAYTQVLADSSAQIPAKPGNTLLAAYITLTYAYCQQTRPAECMKSARMASDIANRDFAPVSLERAHAAMALAFAEWKAGDLETSDKGYQTAMSMMKTLLGENHPVVIIGMLEYRDFLKGIHQEGRVDSINREIAKAQEARAGKECVRCVVRVATLP
jgi:tetratricopeptide (TPR) repeat protein